MLYRSPKDSNERQIFFSEIPSYALVDSTVNLFQGKIKKFFSGKAKAKDKIIFVKNKK